MTEFVTHDVKRFIVEKPKDYDFIPGQATEISINKPNLKNKKRPFTFTSLNNDLVLEFTIKIYNDHNGVTKELGKLNSGDELIIGDPFGTINYKGKGVFIAGGAGITPFIAILRNLKNQEKLKENKLIFSNKTSKDIILEKELKNMFEKNLILILTQELNKENQDYQYMRINENFLKNNIKDFNQNFYICGPKKFVEDIKNYLKKLGAKIQALVFEGKNN